MAASEGEQLPKGIHSLVVERNSRTSVFVMILTEHWGFTLPCPSLNLMSQFQKLIFEKSIRGLSVIRTLAAKLRQAASSSDCPCRRALDWDWVTELMNEHSHGTWTGGTSVCN